MLVVAAACFGATFLLGTNLARRRRRWWWWWWRFVDDHFRVISNVKRKLPLQEVQTHTDNTDTEILGCRKPTPLCTRICPYPFFKATPLGAALGPPVWTGLLRQ